MPEQPVNAPLTPKECVTLVVNEIRDLVADGVCESCAYVLIAKKYDLDNAILFALYGSSASDGLSH